MGGTLYNVGEANLKPTNGSTTLITGYELTEVFTSRSSKHTNFYRFWLVDADLYQGRRQRSLEYMHTFEGSTELITMLSSCYPSAWV